MKKDTTSDIKSEELKCDFMTLNECKRKVAGENPDRDICRLCIMGRMEGHLFDLKAYVGKFTNRNRNNEPDIKHWSERRD